MKNKIMKTLGKKTILTTTILVTTFALAGCDNKPWIDNDLISNKTNQLLDESKDFVYNKTESILISLIADKEKNVKKIKAVVESNDLDSEFKKVNHYVVNRETVELLEKDGLVNNSVALNIDSKHFIDADWYLVRSVKNSQARDILCVDINNSVDTTGFKGEINETSCLGNEGESASMLLSDIPRGLGVDYNEFDALASSITPLTTKLDYDGNIIIHTNYSSKAPFNNDNSTFIRLHHSIQTEIDDYAENAYNSDKELKDLGGNTYTIKMVLASHLYDVIEETVRTAIDYKDLDKDIIL